MRERESVAPYESLVAGTKRTKRKRNYAHWDGVTKLAGRSNVRTPTFGPLRINTPPLRICPGPVRARSKR